jgi:hypothetical protein
MAAGPWMWAWVVSPETELLRSVTGTLASLVLGGWYDTARVGGDRENPEINKEKKCVRNKLKKRQKHPNIQTDSNNGDFQKKSQADDKSRKTHSFLSRID